MIRRDQNGGKGAAVKTGLRAAHELGFSHALQIDADGQHDTADIPKFLARAAERPQAAVLGHPVFDETMPRGRRAAHALTNFMVFVQTGGRAIVDPQCGFRVYPVEPALDGRGRAATGWTSTSRSPSAWSGRASRSSTCPTARPLSCRATPAARRTFGPSAITLRSP